MKIVFHILATLCIFNVAFALDLYEPSPVGSVKVYSSAYLPFGSTAKSIQVDLEYGLAEAQMIGLIGNLGNIGNLETTVGLKGAFGLVREEDVAIDVIGYAKRNFRSEVNTLQGGFLARSNMADLQIPYWGIANINIANSGTLTTTTPEMGAGASWRLNKSIEFIGEYLLAFGINQLSNDLAVGINYHLRSNWEIQIEYSSSDSGTLAGSLLSTF